MLSAIPFRYASGGAGFVKSLAPAAWYRYGIGITSAANLVSQWDDQSGNARHLLQATATNQPTKEADNSITFDGVDNFMKASAFTLNQPETIYWLGKQVTFTANDGLFDGNTVATGLVYQTAGGTPRIGLNAGSDVGDNANLPLDTWAVVSAVINGASSLTQVNNTTAVTGNAGAGNMGGFTLSARGSNAAFGNTSVREVIVFGVAHNAETRGRVIRYLAQVGGI